MKEILIGAHLLGLSLSFMNALSLDTRIARQLLFGTEIHVARAKGAGLLALRSGFFLLLASGIGLLLLYWVKTPELLSNPKIWAKTTIVLIAGLNGCLIERYLLMNKAGECAPGRMPIFFLLSVSWASWFSAFALGVWKSINYVASFQLLMGGYALFVVSLFFGVWGASLKNYSGRRQLRNVPSGHKFRAMEA